MSSELATVNEKAGGELMPMTVQVLKRQLTLIQDVMKEVMKDGTHFGVVPGCGDKKALLKPGAEKLAFVFRLAPEFEVFEKDLGNGHREYRVHCTIKQIGSGTVLGGGVGSASTMEGKYRFRTGPITETGREVPKGYWDVRNTNPAAALESIGGKGFGTKKVNGRWEIVVMGERVEHDNPADYYNTVLKMAKKRAQIDATLTCTAASDIFTQDTYDDFEEDPPLSADGANSAKNVTPAAPVANRSKPVTTEARTQPPVSQDVAKAPANAGGLDWRSHAIHFGKAKGAKLGEIPTENLIWWIRNYAPKPYNGKPPGQDELALRAALDAAKAELESKRDEPAPANDGVQDDIPY